MCDGNYFDYVDDEVSQGQQLFKFTAPTDLYMITDSLATRG